jgi:predicted transglutaminase-like cysteine proteinase
MMNDKIIKLQTSLDKINEHFVYQADPKLFGKLQLDVWKIITKDWKGDCEDYSLTVIWLYSDRNIFKFLWNIISMNFILHFTKAPNEEGHVVTEMRGSRLYFDNIQRKLVTKDDLIRQGYKFVFPMIHPILLAKAIFSILFFWIK